MYQFYLKIVPKSLALLGIVTHLTEATAISKPTGPPPRTARRMFKFKSLQRQQLNDVCLLIQMTVQHSHVIHVVFNNIIIILKAKVGSFTYSHVEESDSIFVIAAEDD